MAASRNGIMTGLRLRVAPAYQAIVTSCRSSLASERMRAVTFAFIPEVITAA